MKRFITLTIELDGDIPDEMVETAMGYAIAAVSVVNIKDNVFDGKLKFLRVESEGLSPMTIGGDKSE